MKNSSFAASWGQLQRMNPTVQKPNAARKPQLAISLRFETRTFPVISEKEAMI
ncbi:MAG: hypothetical protein IIC78_09215 [Chloroflexi bacterium]|nr:hypothetical protein [Chloroflexota bacterium]